MLRPSLALAVCLAAVQAQAREPVRTLRELGPAFAACWRAPPGSEGSEITLRFSLKRDGGLLGKPRITYSRLSGDEEARRRFVAAALAAVAECLPAPIAPELGATIAGRPLTLRLGGTVELRAPQQTPFPFYDSI